MNKTVWLGVIIWIALMAAGYYYYTQRQAEQASPAQPGHRAFLRCRIGHTHSRTVTVSCDSGSARVLI